MNADANLEVMGEFIIGGFDCENSGLLCLLKLAIPMFKWRLGGLNLHFCQKLKSDSRKIAWIWGHAISELETFV